LVALLGRRFDRMALASGARAGANVPLLPAERVEVAGRTFFVGAARKAMDLDIIAEVYARDCYKLAAFTACVRPKIALDIGGHLGSFTVRLKKLVPEARVFAVEPTPESAALFRQNVADFADVTIVERAIAYSPDKNVLVESAANSGGAKVLTEAEALRGVAPGSARPSLHDVFWVSGRVETTTLEALLAAEHLGDVDLVKLDCEGGELDLLAHMDPAVAPRLRTIVGEYHHPGGWPAFAALLQRRFPEHRIRGRAGPDGLGTFMASNDPRVPDAVLAAIAG
jgi:FkbM family methyltransferase